MANEKATTQKGSISIDAQNIMPVIKRWLYSDKDIFIREIVSNGVDAITKLRMLGLGDGEDLKVTVTVDKKKREISVSDNGIGMTAEEVDKYINQVAFSSAEEFLKNYAGEDPAGIIGHFGLGFYSAFMAADRVTIDSFSCQEGAEAVAWESKDGITFEMKPGLRAERGTTITMHLMKEEDEFLESSRIREVLEKYCGYMSVPVILADLESIRERRAEHEKRRKEWEKEAGKKKKEQGKAEKAEEGSGEEVTADNEPFSEPEPSPVQINDTKPLWLKSPKECNE
ncbi:MAG: ATP-binding protein, partial [Eubacteriales bacterium]|nr:ATP-binding protein [Eubacteriales bacterium]